MEIIKFKHNLSYYIKLFDTRKQNNDLFGALDAAKNALKYAGHRIQKESVNLLIGQVYYEMGQYSLSCEYYFRALEVPQTMAGAYFGVGRNLVNMRKFLLALDYFDKVLEYDVNNIFTQSVLEWTDFIKKQISFEDKQTFLENNLLNIKKLIKQKQYIKAHNILQNAINLNPQDPTLLLLEAECFIGEGNIDSARQNAKNVLKTFPYNADARLVLCKICRLDDDDTSLKTLISGIELNNINNAQKLELAQLYVSVGQNSEAIDVLKFLIKQVPYSPKLFLYLGICYYNILDTQNALYYLAQARWIDYENPVLTEFYKIFNNFKYTLQLTDQLPKDIINNKLSDIHTSLNNPKFINNWLHSSLLVDQTDWLLTTKYYALSDNFLSILSTIKSKKALKYYKKALLSVRYNIHQKYLLTKYALINKNLKIVNVTTNFIYRSFFNRLPAFCSGMQIIKNSVASALAYAECFANYINIIPTAKNIYLNILDKNLETQIDENTLTCLMFYNYNSELKSVCNYFNVDIAKVENTKSLLNL